jgi:hypothetical protein
MALNTPFVDGKIKGMSGGGSSSPKASKKMPKKMKSGK